MVATDFSPESERAQALAYRLAQSLGTRLHLLHVVEPISADAEDADADTFHGELSERARRQLAAAATTMPEVEVGHSVVIGHRALVISQEAARLDALMVVVGTHQWTPGHAMLPVVSHEVAFRSDRPVVLVP